MMDKVLICEYVIYVNVFLVGSSNKSVIRESFVYFCWNFDHETNTWVSTIILFLLNK